MRIYTPGYYNTRFGELWDKGLRELAIEAATGALEVAAMSLNDIDAIYISNMCASRFSGQDHLGALIASDLHTSIPSCHIEAACASGSVAIRTAFLDIMSGTSNNVLVIGVEKMSDVTIDMATTGLTGASDEEWEAYYGATFPSLYAMIARAHMNKYKTTKEQLALTAVKNHQNATLNPKAHFRKPITVEEVIRAPMVADPLGLYDCSPISDGAAAIILSNKHKKGAQLLSIEQAQASIALHDRNDITKLEATVQAAGKAYTKTNLKPTDISIMEVHDCFTIAEICAYEDLGLVEKGKGGQLIESGKVNIDGSIPVNTSGGLKAAGHPVGATGIKQAVEIISQLSGNAKERQVKHDLKYGLTHNVGGSGATCVVGIWGKI